MTALWNRTPLVFGHRGAAIERPENTLVSFARALEAGAHALEMDVHLTSDGVVVVAHDDDLVRMGNDVMQIKNAAYVALRRVDVGHGFVAGGLNRTEPQRQPP